jgi:hypothetical protein
MNAPASYPDLARGGGRSRPAWLIAALAWGMVLVAAALVLDLHNQRRRLETLNERLKPTAALRDAESKNLDTRTATAQATLARLRDLAGEREAELRKLGELFAQRAPILEQTSEAQEKLQSLAHDILDLAKTDTDAREIARKYNIQQTTTPPATDKPK